MRCVEVAQHATEYTEGGLGPLAYFRASRHLASCDGCSRYVAQLQAGARALPVLATAPLPEAHEAAALSMFRQWQAQTAQGQAPIVAQPELIPRRPRLWPVLAWTSGAFALGLLTARHPAPWGTEWLQALLLMAAASLLLGVARERAGLALGLSALASALPALLAHDAGLGVATGVQCALHELATGGVAVVAMVGLRRMPSGTRLGFMAVAAAGAVSGDAALHISCRSASSLQHLLVFHVGGLLLTAALAGAAAGRLWPVQQADQVS